MRSLDGRTVASGSAGANLSPVTCEELNPPAKSRINHWFSGESRAVSWGAPKLFIRILETNWNPLPDPDPKR